MRIIKKIFGTLFTVGCVPPFNSSESRITIFTNTMAYWGFLVTIPIFTSLQAHGIDPILFAVPYFIILSVTFSILVFNYFHRYNFARVSGWIVLNFIGWQAVTIYGKSFNGYLTFIPALAYGIISLSKLPPHLRAILAAVPLLGMLSADYFTHSQIFPITNLNSSQFHVAVLWIDSITIFGFMAILLFVEKSYYDKYETELQNLNENLEQIVEKRTAMLVKAKEEAVQASLLKSQFVANTSHELRTPVQGLMGFVSMAKRRIEKVKSSTKETDEMLAKALGSLESADQSSQRLMNLIDTLLQITRTESEGFTPRPSRFSVSEAVSESIRETSEKAKQKKMNVLFFDEKSTTEVYTDRTLVVQVLENLLTNAIHYGTTGTDISINIQEEIDQIAIRVANKGAGIDPDDVERIFEPFVQGRRTDNTTGGTGLGLSLCRKYAKALRGSLVLENPAAENTVFKFLLLRDLSK